MIVEWNDASDAMADKLTRAYVNDRFAAYGYGTRSRARRRAVIKRIRTAAFDLLFKRLSGYAGSKLSSTILGVANGLVGVVLADAVLEGELIRLPFLDNRGNDYRYRLSPQKWIEMAAAA